MTKKEGVDHGFPKKMIIKDVISRRTKEFMVYAEKIGVHYYYGNSHDIFKLIIWEENGMYYIGRISDTHEMVGLVGTNGYRSFDLAKLDFDREPIEINPDLKSEQK